MENCVNGNTVGTAEASGIGPLGAERVDPARVWGETRNTTAPSELVAAGLTACRRWGWERRSRRAPGGVHRSAIADERCEDVGGAGDRPAQRASGAGADGSRYRYAAAGAPGPADDMLTLPAPGRVFVSRGATALRPSLGPM